jgi:hypothetical protein|tara:strand:+ start:1152 stop:1304 length:153 start_codon:yes stop_codon:yes gene_type:complete
MDDNIDIDKKDLDFIRSLKDFDLKMFLSEINEHGWEKATALIPYIRKTLN